MARQIFAAASPAGWPVWVDILLLIGLLFASLIGSIARARQRAQPSTSGYFFGNVAQDHPALYAALLAVLMFIGIFWVAATNHLPLGLSLVLSLLIGAGAGVLGAIVGLIVHRSQPSS